MSETETNLDDDAVFDGARALLHRVQGGGVVRSEDCYRDEWSLDVDMWTSDLCRLSFLGKRGHT